MATYRAGKFRSRILALAVSLFARAEIARIARELAAARSRSAEIDVLFEKLYEDNVSGKVTDERYARQSARYDDEQRGLQEKISELDELLGSRRASKLRSDDFAATVRRYSHAKKLTARLLAELVDHIEVYPQEISQGEKTQKLAIHYRCIGELALPATAPDADVVMNTRRGVVTRYAG